MKTLYSIVFLSVFISFNAQTNNIVTANLKAIYKLEFKKFVDADKTSTENMTLFQLKDGATTFLNSKMMLIDSIQKIRIIDVSDLASLVCVNNFIVQQSSDKYHYLESLGSDIFSFEQNIKLNWELVSERKLINNYNCKKATVSYGGRDWIAWYSIDIASTSGPYIFKGLPGLILEVSDVDNVFHFTIESLQYGLFKINGNLGNYFIKDAHVKKPVTVVNSTDFYKARNNYNKLSLDERMKYINLNSAEKAGTMIITSPQGEILNTNRPSKVRNFIERVE